MYEEVLRKRFEDQDSENLHGGSRHTSQQVIALRLIRGLANNGSPTVRGESGDAITASLAHG